MSDLFAERATICC